jgi:hypothetical protein
VVIAMAVTRDGVPVRCRTFGPTSELCWLALLLTRVIENTTGDTWRNIRNELDRLHLVTLATAEGHVAQRSQVTTGQKQILTALEVPEPPRFYDFTTG